MLTYALTADDLASYRVVVEELMGTFPPAAHPAWCDHGWWLRQRIPHGVHDFLDRFRRTESEPVAMITGFPVDDDAIGHTPTSWQAAASAQHTADHDHRLALTALALGDPFGWSTLQAARMVHNVMPVAGEEAEQSGHGSGALLAWHTEDAFHPGRCDYLMLLGMRNIDRVPTTVAHLDGIELTEEQLDMLFARRFHILPDDEHLRQLAQQDPDHPGLRHMRDMRENPEPVAVLSGDRRTPYLCIDPVFMECADDDARTADALATVIDHLDRTQQDVVVEAGTILIVDNYRAVHGRRAFSARYDGTDRWLKKMVVARDLRRSREHRDAASSRILY